MHPKLPFTDTLSDFMSYLAAMKKNNAARLPALTTLSQELGVSVATLREQLEVARALGVVEVRPRTGIRPLPYSFLPAVDQSLAYALAVDPQNFQRFADLRTHVETAYWYEAVKRLTAADHSHLQDLVVSALQKLNGSPAQVPHSEHRELHLCMYCRLENPFVTGILEAYWDAYERVGLNLFMDHAYLLRVWQYHQQMVNAVCTGDYAAGFQALREHVDLLQKRPQHHSQQRFE